MRELDNLILTSCEIRGRAPGRREAKYLALPLGKTVGNTNACLVD